MSLANALKWLNLSGACIAPLFERFVCHVELALCLKLHCQLWGNHFVPLPDAPQQMCAHIKLLGLSSGTAI